MSTRGLSSHCLRSASRRLALEPPGWLFSLRRADGALAVRRELAVDDPEELLGLVADDDWNAIALVLPGRIADPDRTCDDVTLSYVVDRRGRSALAVGAPAGTDSVESLVPAAGLVADITQRMFGLACRPEPTTSAVLVVSVWLQNLLDTTSDSDASGGVRSWSDAVGRHPAWRAGGGPFQARVGATPPRPDELAELTLGIARHLTWTRMRGLAADGTIVIPGLAASDATWMDDPFFARWTLGVHRPVTELLDDLSLFIDGGVLRDVRYTVDAVGWLGFADSHAS